MSNKTHQIVTHVVAPGGEILAHLYLSRNSVIDWTPYQFNAMDLREEDAEEMIASHRSAPTITTREGDWTQRMLWQNAYTQRI